MLNTSKKQFSARRQVPTWSKYYKVRDPALNKWNDSFDTNIWTDRWTTTRIYLKLCGVGARNSPAEEKFGVYAFLLDTLK